ncbi:MAG: hypothetical protein AAGA18_11225 [Verrucomicrobiota bacterium]
MEANRVLKKITAFSIVEGMVMRENVEGKDGSIILKKGQVLDEESIKKLSEAKEDEFLVDLGDLRKFFSEEEIAKTQADLSSRFCHPDLQVAKKMIELATLQRLKTQYFDNI